MQRALDTRDVPEINDSQGTALPPALQADAEATFQADFNHVRIHNDGAAAQAARNIHANAFTADNHIYFSSGLYRPETAQGRELIGHELTHVLQQRRGLQASYDAYERDAEVMGRAFAIPPIARTGSLRDVHPAAERDAATARSAPVSGAAQGPSVLQRQEAAPIDRDRDVRLTPRLRFDDLGLTLDFLQGRHRFGLSTDLTNPTNLLTTLPGIGPSNFAASIFYDNRCNEAFQSGIIEYRQRQQAGGPVFSDRNPWSISGAFSFRVGSTLIGPGADVGFQGGNLDSIGLTLSIIPGVSTRIPDECTPQRRTPQTPPPTSTTPPTRRTPPTTTTPEREPTPEGDRPPQPAMLQPMTIFFYYDSSIRRVESNTMYDLMLQAMQTFPNLRVRLTGHTSLEGRERYNLGLSRRRAEAVRDGLTMAGIEASRIEVFWLGEYAPALSEPRGPRGEEQPHSFTGPLEAIRDMNRRVEVEFIDPQGRVAPTSVPLRLTTPSR